MVKRLCYIATAVAFWVLFCLWPMDSLLIPIWGIGAAAFSLTAAYVK